MSVQIKMPALSSTSDEGKICKWLVREGQKVRPGDLIAEVETDDSIIEIEAVEEGAIVKFLVAEGSIAKVNAPIATLDQGASGTAPRDVSSAPGPRLGSVSPAAYTPPTAMVRTRFKSAREDGTQTDKRIASVAPTTIAPQAAGGPVRTTFVRGAEMQSDPVVGWLVIVKGPGRGSFQPVFPGMNPIGRDQSQRICLNYGDDTISRQEHAFITYDDEQRRFYLQHGGKANLIRVGDQPVLVPTELRPSDIIRIGKTTLRFVPLCGSEFSWDDAG